MNLLRVACLFMVFNGRRTRFTSSAAKNISHMLICTYHAIKPKIDSKVIQK